MKNFDEWWDKTGKEMCVVNDSFDESVCKAVAKQAIFGMREELFYKNQKVQDLIVLGDNKTSDNYRAEGWYQFSDEIKKWIGL